MFPYRKVIKAITGGLVLCLLLSICGVYGQGAGVRKQVVRLHILAHSDSAEDQTLKLQVRDAVVQAAAGWLDEADTTEEALETTRRRLPEVEAVARQVVREAGYDYAVTAEQTPAYFTTRQYDTVTLPAGTYEAVRITIGDGAGQNWWCVVYPPLCAGAATDRSDLSTVLDPSQEALVSDGQRYILRFKVLEWLESLLRLFRATE